MFFNRVYPSTYITPNLGMWRWRRREDRATRKILWKLASKSPNCFHAHGDAEDIARIQTIGLCVVNDNKPAPENIPKPGIPETTSRICHEWGWLGIDHWRASYNNNVNAIINGISACDLKYIFCFYVLHVLPKGSPEESHPGKNKHEY